jgi:hypothetical protein
LAAYGVVALFPVKRMIFHGALLNAGLSRRPVNKTAPELGDLRVSLCRGQVMDVRAESALCSLIVRKR